MFRRTRPGPLRPTVGNTVGLTTRFSGSYPMNSYEAQLESVDDELGVLADRGGVHAAYVVGTSWYTFVGTSWYTFVGTSWYTFTHPNRTTLYLLYTSLRTGELNAVRKHKCFLCSPFYGEACRWAMLGAFKS